MRMNKGNRSRKSDPRMRKEKRERPIANDGKLRKRNNVCCSVVSYGAHGLLGIEHDVIGER